MNIFIAFPFSQLIEKRTGKVCKKSIQFLDELRSTLMNAGHYVFLAHYREKWGKELMGPYECTPDDFAEMKKADMILAFPGWPISGGVHVELGWASALGKKIVLMLKKGCNYSPLILGINTITHAEIFYYHTFKNKEVMQMIAKYFNNNDNEKSA